jgi:hypothetical protein
VRETRQVEKDVRLGLVHRGVDLVGDEDLARELDADVAADLAHPHVVAREGLRRQPQPPGSSYFEEGRFVFRPGFT